MRTHTHISVDDFTIECRTLMVGKDVIKKTFNDGIAEEYERNF